MATTTQIPVTLVRETSGTDITVTGGNVVLPEGNYLVSYGVEGKRTTNGALTASLYQNGTPLTGESVTETVSTGETVNASKTTVVNSTAAGTTLGLYNTSGAEATFSNAYITVLKL